jgi:hypothetical protein
MDREEVWVQVATRIPKPLRQKLKLYCAETNRSVMGFIAEALREKLERGSGRRGGKLGRPLKARGMATVRTRSRRYGSGVVG